MPDDDKFCASCGAALALREREGQVRPVCPACGRVVFYDPKLVAVTIVSRGDQVLMVCRAREPGYGLWSIPGGYVDRGEVVEAAAAREVWEETGLEIDIAGLLGIFSEAGRSVVVAAYAGSVAGGNLQAGPETLDADFFHPDALPSLAFPQDTRLLACWQEYRHTGRK